MFIEIILLLFIFFFDTLTCLPTFANVFRMILPDLYKLGLELEKMKKNREENHQFFLKRCRQLTQKRRKTLENYFVDKLTISIIESYCSDLVVFEDKELNFIHLHSTTTYPSNFDHLRVVFEDDNHPVKILLFHSFVLEYSVSISFESFYFQTVKSGSFFDDFWEFCSCRL